MLNLKRLSQYFSFSQESDELVSERYRNCMRQIPLMYLILGINMVLICIVHIGVVPAALIIYFPAAFLFIFVLRIYFWLRSRSIQKSISQIRSDLSTTIFLAAAISCVCVIWSVALFFLWRCTHKGAGHLFYWRDAYNSYRLSNGTETVSNTAFRHRSFAGFHILGSSKRADLYSQCRQFGLGHRGHDFRYGASQPTLSKWRGKTEKAQ